MRNIVYLTDENYAMPTCVSIVSLMKNNTSKINYKVYILVNEISVETRERLQVLEDKYVTCEIIDVYNMEYESLAATCRTKGIHVSKTALFKFDIANILADLDEVLYLDGDVIINRELTDLFETDISDYYLAAVDDMGDEFTIDGKSTLAKRINIEDRSYFNSGIMYLNLKKMRQDKISEKLLKYRMEEPNYFMDQDALNVVIGVKRKALPYKFNFRMPIIDELELKELCKRFYELQYDSIDECLNKQVIIHMTDRRKPWVYNIPWATELFQRYYRESPFLEHKLKLESYVRAKNEHLLIYKESYHQLHEMYTYIVNERQRKIWPFPYHKIEKGSKVILYGAGNVGQDMYSQILQTEYCELVLWVDKNWEKIEKNVKNPKLILETIYDAIIIAVANQELSMEIKQNLIDLGIEGDKVFNIF